jgi:hypothetical protein
MVQWAELIDSWFDNFMQLTETERADRLFQVLCCGVATICLFVCLYNWQVTLRDVGFIAGIALIYAVAKLYLTLIEIALPE